MYIGEKYKAKCYAGCRRLYLNFLTECTQESDTHVRTSTLYEAFKTWFVTNNPKMHIPSNREFTINLKKHKIVEKVKVAGLSVNGIKKIKLLDEYA